jgi:phage shock protein PspC (stress-responsive transcriptional regulator)
MTHDDTPERPDAGPATPPAAGPPGAPTEGPPPAGGPEHPAGPPADQARRRLVRSRNKRMIAGVAAGLGEYAGVDPVLFRVLFAVLALPIFGWVGLLLYLVGWLLLPDDGEDASPAESMLGRGGRNAGTSIEGVLLAAGAALLAILLIRHNIGDGGDVALLLVIVIGGLLLLRNIDARRRPVGPVAGFRPGGPPPAYPSVPYPSPYGPYAGSGQPAPGPAGTGALTTPMSTVGAPTAPLTAAGATVPPYSYGNPPPTPPPYGYGNPPPTPPPPVPRPAPSVLGRLTLSALAVALGVLGLLDATTGHDITARHYLALALAVLGTGLLLGTLLGRARWLIWVGVPLTVALIATSTAEVVFRGGIGDRAFTLTTANGIADRYEVGAGTMTVDLSAVDFTDRDIHTDVRVGIGDLQITVPPNVDVTIRVHAGVGDVTLFGVDYSGAGVTQAVTDDGSDGAGGGSLDLVLNVSLGQVEVLRA